MTETRTTEDAKAGILLLSAGLDTQGEHDAANTLRKNLETLTSRLEAATRPMRIEAVELRCTCDGGDCDDESEWLVWDAEHGWLPMCIMHEELTEAERVRRGD